MATNETWLSRHGLYGHAVTPLVAARLGMRRRVGWLTAGLFLAAATGLALALGAGSDGRSPDFLGTLQRSAALPLVALLVTKSWLSPYLLRRHDRRLARTITVRVTHPAPWGWLAVVGRGHVVVAAASYGGSLLIGLLALLAAPPSTRLAAAVAAGVLVVLGASTAWEVQRIVTRPTLADDDLTLAVDDEVRVEDARNALSPALPPLLAMWTLPHVLTPPVLTILVAAAFGLLVLVTAGLLWVYGTKRPGRQLAGVR
jgi:hypothetical protein